MTDFNRREFLGAVAASAGALTLNEAAFADDKRPKKLSDKVTLGKTGLKSSIIAMGTGSVGYNKGSNQTRLGQEKFTALVEHAWSRGVRFFDVADSYGSHPYLREAIKALKLPRDKYVLMTKTFSRKPEEVKADLDRFRKELDTDYVDILLMHCVTEADWNVRFQGVKDVLSQAKASGFVKHHGCSCHSFEALKAAAADPWVEIDLARYNPWGLHMDHQNSESKDKTPQAVGDVLRGMRAAGKGVIGMKILGQGDMMKGPDRVQKMQETLKFAFGTGAIDMMSIGFESPMQIDEVFGQARVALAELNQRSA